MRHISTLTRISLALSTLTVSVLIAVHYLGFVPDADALRKAETLACRSVAESIAVQCSIAAQKNDLESIRIITESIVRRNNAIMKMKVVYHTGKVLAAAEREATGTAAEVEQNANLTAIVVPISRHNKPWGTVEVDFLPAPEVTGLTWWGSSLIPLAFVLGLSSFLAFMWYLRKVLSHLDPSAVIPERVRAALNTLAEGVVVLDMNDRVVLVSTPFARTVNRPLDSIFGRRISTLPWEFETPLDNNELPWLQVMKSGEAITGAALKIAGSDGKRLSLSVNAVPIQGSGNSCRGVLVTFDDLTLLEEKNDQLNGLLHSLEVSNEEIRKQNEDLHFLATRDSLTSCLNRRAFFALAEEAWVLHEQQAGTMGCVMVDIDHFKSFNDDHGHATGDKVLQHVAGILRTGVRAEDLVCRYGGEEFCLLLPNVNLAEAAAITEGLRQRIASEPCDALTITASLGVCISGGSASSLQTALDQADKSLYASKRSGRNRVTSWQELVDRGETELAPEKSQTRRKEADGTSEFLATSKTVRALAGAMAVRDPETASHCGRVAELCVALGNSLLPERELRLLECAAVLHDLGKIGIPDAILNKPGKLNDDEWRVMGKHDEIGARLIAQVLPCPELEELVRVHHSWFTGHPREPELPTGLDIPLGARILGLCDAYDAMVSKRVYRAALTHDEALAEIRRCAGTQFDPEIAVLFLEKVAPTLAGRSNAPPRPSLGSTADSSVTPLRPAVSKTAPAAEAAVLCISEELLQLVAQCLPPVPSDVG